MEKWRVVGGQSAYLQDLLTGGGCQFGERSVFKLNGRGRGVHFKHELTKQTWLVPSCLFLFLRGQGTVRTDYYGIRCEEDYGMVLPLTVLLSLILGSSSNNDGTKESVYIRKEFNSHRICLDHQHGSHFIVWPPWRRAKPLYRRLKGNWGRVSRQRVQEGHHLFKVDNINKKDTKEIWYRLTP